MIVGFYCGFITAICIAVLYQIICFWGGSVKLRHYPIIEWDQNMAKIYDIVTNDHAEEFEIGKEIIVVCSDHKDRVLDFGTAFHAKVTEIKQLDDGNYIIRAEAIYDDFSL